MNKIYTTLILLLLFSIQAQAQPNVDVANATLVNTFPYVENNFSSAGGGTATGLQGTCPAIPCCSVLVYKIVTPLPGSIRADLDNFSPFTQTIIAYTANVPNPTTWSDLTYFSGEPGNFCGFRDSMQLGRGYWPPSGGYAHPASVSQYIPAGEYYILVLNENQQNNLGIGSLNTLTFRYAPACPNNTICTSVNETYCDGSAYIAPSGQSYSATGSYQDTALGVAAGGWDSITFITIESNYTILTQDILPDTSLCTDDTLRQEAVTNYVSYAAFSGSNYININPVAAPLANSNRSAFMWMKQGLAVANNQVLLGINTSGGGNVANLQIGTNQELQVYDGGTTQSSGVTVTDGLWHYVGYTYDNATGETNVYIDGTEVLTYVNGQNSIATSQFSLGQEFDNGNPSDFYTGEMTEISIWNTVLSAADIGLGMQAVIKNTHPNYANLVAYYPCLSICNTANISLLDYSANNNDGTATTEGLLVNTIFEQIPNFNSADWYTKEWSSTNLGAAFSSANSINLQLTATDNFTLVLKRDYLEITETWTVDPRSATQAEIVVEGNNLLITDGNLSPQVIDGTDYGDMEIGASPISKTFTIKNTGNIALDITGLTLSGLNASDFSITSMPVNSLNAGGSTTFTVEFNPVTPVGEKVATIEISNSDCNESFYTFEIKGVALGTLFSEVRGQMLSLNGTSDHVIIDNVAGAIAGATEFTFEAWINADATQAGNDRIVCVNTSGGGNVVLFHLDNGRIKTYDGATDTYGSPDLRGTGWHHVAFTHDNTTHRVYLDGVLLGSKGGSVSTFAANNQWSIGQEWDNGSKGDYFKGKMDEVRIWKDVRTQQEIRERMHLSLESKNLLSTDDNLVAYYQFDTDEVVGTVNGVKDVLGNNGTSFGVLYSNSEVAVGKGFSSTQVVNAAGNYMFANTDLELTFSGLMPNDEVVVTKIITELPHNESINIMGNNPGVYWVVDNYGVNAGLNAMAKFKFADGAIANTLNANHQIHKRGSREYEVADWADFAASTVGMSAGNNHVSLHNISDFSQFALTSNISTFVSAIPSLPIELMSFKVERPSIDQVELYWITATEVNNKGFYIERMLDVEDEFKSIGWVDGHGTTAAVMYYRDTDENSYEGISYYRLKQIDFDGTTTYSEIRAVVGIERTPIDVNVYPNPAQNYLNIRFDNLPEEVETAKIEIKSINGQILSSKVVSLDAYEVLQINEIELLIPSIYLLSIQMDNGELLLYKFIKE
jgi:hypothetical protein